MPVSIDDWNRMVNRSASSLAHVLRSFPGIPSGPVALCSSVSLRSLSTPTPSGNDWNQVKMSENNLKYLK